MPGTEHPAHVLRGHGTEPLGHPSFLHAEGSTYRVHDFSVEAVSLVNDYRQSFNRLLANGTLDALIESPQSAQVELRRTHGWRIATFIDLDCFALT